MLWLITKFVWTHDLSSDPIIQNSKSIFNLNEQIIGAKEIELGDYSDINGIIAIDALYHQYLIYQFIMIWIHQHSSSEKTPPPPPSKIDIIYRGEVFSLGGGGGF